MGLELSIMSEMPLKRAQTQLRRQLDTIERYLVNSYSDVLMHALAVGQQSPEQRQHANGASRLLIDTQVGQLHITRVQLLKLVEDHKANLQFHLHLTDMLWHLVQRLDPHLNDTANGELAPPVAAKLANDELGRIEATLSNLTQSYAVFAYTRGLPEHSESVLEALSTDALDKLRHSNGDIPMFLEMLNANLALLMRDVLQMSRGLKKANQTLAGLAFRFDLISKLADFNGYLTLVCKDQSKPVVPDPPPPPPVCPRPRYNSAAGVLTPLQRAQSQNVLNELNTRRRTKSLLRSSSVNRYPLKRREGTKRKLVISQTMSSVPRSETGTDNVPEDIHYPVFDNISDSGSTSSESSTMDETLISPTAIPYQMRIDERLARRRKSGSTSPRSD